MPRKADANEIIGHMRQLRSSLRLNDSRSFWPNWLFRSDHVENAASILNSGRLLSRAAAEKGDVIQLDSGSPDYVNELSSQHRNFVRLYFRPRTPTQYINEGIRPKSKIELGAHMPVPIYLLFAASLLGDEGVCFTKGRLTDRTDVGSTAKFLKSIDFGNVYHDQGVGRFGSSDRKSMVLNARHSEVVTENELSLDKLRHIVCRSIAERDTLLNLLGSETRRRWAGKVVVDDGYRRMFHKLGTFVKRVDLSSSNSRILFNSNIDRDMRGPFDIEIERSVAGRTERRRRTGFVVSNNLVVLTFNSPASKYILRVLLDGNLAYLGKFDQKQDPDTVF